MPTLFLSLLLQNLMTALMAVQLSGCCCLNKNVQYSWLVSTRYDSYESYGLLTHRRARADAWRARLSPGVRCRSPLHRARLSKPSRRGFVWSTRTQSRTWSSPWSAQETKKMSKNGQIWNSPYSHSASIKSKNTAKEHRFSSLTLSPHVQKVHSPNLPKE